MIDTPNHMEEAYDYALDGAMAAVKQLIDTPSDEARTLLQTFIEAARSAKQAQEDRGADSVDTSGARVGSVIDWGKVGAPATATIMSRLIDLYRTTPKPKPPVIDWEQYGRSRKYFAIDASGIGYVYNEKPRVVGSNEIWSTREAHHQLGVFELNGVDWRCTLTEYPNHPPTGVTRRADKPTPATPPVLDWDNYPPEYKWFAVDEDGRGFVYDTKPYLERDATMWRNGEGYELVGQFAVTPLNWHATLTQRPNQPPPGITQEDEPHAP